MLALLIFTLSAPAPLLAQALRIEGARILWAGTFSAKIVGTVDQPDTAAGRTNKLSSIQKLETTTTIRGQRGASFGFEYVVVGAPLAAQAVIEVVVILPEAGLLNPATGKRTQREKWRPSLSPIGGTTLVGYQFGKEWEIVPGLWTFEIWHTGRKLGEQSFCVIAEDIPTPSEGGAGSKEPCHSAATA